MKKFDVNDYSLRACVYFMLKKLIYSRKGFWNIVVYLTGVLIMVADIIGIRALDWESLSLYAIMSLITLSFTSVIEWSKIQTNINIGK